MLGRESRPSWGSNLPLGLSCNCPLLVSAAAAAKSLQSCPTLCDSIIRLPCSWDSPGKNTGVGYHFLLQCIKVKSESEVAQSVPLFVTPWTAAYRAPLSMGFSRQEYWSGVPLPSPHTSGYLVIISSCRLGLCLKSLLLQWKHLIMGL